jgi:hypothetical protein
MTEAKRTTQTATHAPKRTAMDGAAGYTSMMAMSNALMETTSEAYQSYIKSIMSLSEAFLSFATARMQSNVRASEELMRCRAVPDALRVQQEWLREASDQYMSEATKLVDIATQSTLKSIDPLMKRSAAIFEQHAA